MADDVNRLGSRRRGGGRSLLRPSGLAQPVVNLLALRKIRMVVAPRRPRGAGVGDGVGRVERETGLGGGSRLVNTTELREGGRQIEIYSRIISIDLDRPSTPR